MINGFCYQDKCICVAMRTKPVLIGYSFILRGNKILLRDAAKVEKNLPLRKEEEAQRVST
jgi:hypothetical protein